MRNKAKVDAKDVAQSCILSAAQMVLTYFENHEASDYTEKDRARIEKEIRKQFRRVEKLLGFIPGGTTLL